jgi:hypothetical protein
MPRLRISCALLPPKVANLAKWHRGNKTPTFSWAIKDETVREKAQPETHSLRVIHPWLPQTRQNAGCLESRGAFPRGSAGPRILSTANVGLDLSPIKVPDSQLPELGRRMKCSVAGTELFGAHGNSRRRGVEKGVKRYTERGSERSREISGDGLTQSRKGAKVEKARFLMAEKKPATSSGLRTSCGRLRPHFSASMNPSHHHRFDFDFFTEFLSSDGHGNSIRQRRRGRLNTIAGLIDGPSDRAPPVAPQVD